MRYFWWFSNNEQFLILGSILKSWKVAKILFFSALLRKKLWIVAKETKVIFQKNDTLQMGAESNMAMMTSPLKKISKTWIL